MHASKDATNYKTATKSRKRSVQDTGKELSKKDLKVSFVQNGRRKSRGREEFAVYEWDEYMDGYIYTEIENTMLLKNGSVAMMKERSEFLVCLNLCPDWLEKESWTLLDWRENRHSGKWHDGANKNSSDREINCVWDANAFARCSLARRRMRRLGAFLLHRSWHHYACEAFGRDAWKKGRVWSNAMLPSTLHLVGLHF